MGDPSRDSPLVPVPGTDGEYVGLPGSVVHGVRIPLEACAPSAGQSPGSGIDPAKNAAPGTPSGGRPSDPASRPSRDEGHHSQPLVVGAKALVIVQDHYLRLVRSLTSSHAPGGWDFPGGRHELHRTAYTRIESPLSAICRELYEEIGHSLPRETLLQPLDVQDFTRDDGQRVLMVVYRVELRFRPPIHLSAEHQVFFWCPLTDTSELPDRLRISVERAVLLVRAGL